MIDQNKAPKISLSKGAFKDMWPWLKRAYLFWIFLGVVILITWVGDWIWGWNGLEYEKRFQYTGAVLELLGLFSAAYGLDDNLKLYTGQSTWQRIKKWFYEFPLLRQDVTVSPISAHISIGFNVPRARLTGSLKPDATPDEKIAFLMDRFKNLVDNLHDLTDEVGQIKTDLVAKIEEGKQEIDKRIEEVDKRAEKAHVGDLGWTFVGLGWVAVGITYATLPGPVFRFFQPLIKLLTI